VLLVYKIQRQPNSAHCVSSVASDLYKGQGKGSVDETWRGVELARRLQAAGIVFDQI